MGWQLLPHDSGKKALSDSVIVLFASLVVFIGINEASLSEQLMQQENLLSFRSSYLCSYFYSLFAKLKLLTCVFVS